MSAWNEARHPRRRDGRFGRGEIWARPPEQHLDTGFDWVQPPAQVAAHRPEDGEVPVDPHDARTAAEFDEFVEQCNREEYAERTSVEGAVPRVPTADDYAFLAVLPYSQRREAEIAFRALERAVEARAAWNATHPFETIPPFALITISEANDALRVATEWWRDEHPDAPDDSEAYVMDLVGGE